MQCFGYGSTYPSCFQYLVELNIHVYQHSSWHVLQDLLQNAPNLEFLFVTNEVSLLCAMYFYILTYLQYAYFNDLLCLLSPV